MPNEITPDSVNPNDPTITPNDPTPAPQPEVVDKKVYETVKADMHRFKSEREKLQKEIDDMKMAKLKDAQNWEEIAKMKEQEAQEYKSKYQGLASSLVDNEKYKALEREALKAGILPQGLNDLSLLDFAEIQVETTSTGKIIVNGADKAIQSLKLARPHWFGVNPVTINSTTPEVLTPTGAISIADLENLETQYKKNPHDQLIKAKSFDAIQKFKTQ